MYKCLFCESESDEKLKYVCKKCNDKIKLIKEFKNVDKAQDIMQKGYLNRFNKIMPFYEEKDKIISRITNDKYKFKSVPELCVGLEFELENISYIPNKKIGPYEVDFYLPEEKRILEIDGKMFHNEDRDFLRDRCIMHIVGEEFEIIRLSSELVPRFILGNMREKMNFVIENRNSDNRFRDTRWDWHYFEKYFSLKSHEKKIGRE